jgi:hypothetical protein
MSAYIKFKPNPITDYLIENWGLILDEFIAQRKAKMGHNLLEVQDESNKINGPMVHNSKPVYLGKIIAAALYVKHEVLTPKESVQLNFPESEKERWWQDNIEQMPTLKKWINTYQEHLAAVVFYAAQPGSSINHHYGVDSTYQNFRLHLCLTGDPECKFNIENEIHSWVPGDLFGFDDAMYYHGIKHRGTTPRIILSIDIKKSALREFAIDFVERPYLSLPEKPFPIIQDW